MSQGLLRAENGFSDEVTSVLSGSGAPGGDASFQDAAPVGSIYKRTSNGDLYIKDTAGTGTDKWEILATQTFATQIGGGASWREIVLLRDNTLYASVSAAQTAANVGDTLDGVTIAATDRILLSNLTAGNENVYIVSGSTGAWTFTEDTNAATSGDRVSITNGTDAGKVFYYDGTTWVFTNQSSTQEEGFIRTYVGKTAAGSETPTYTTNNVVTTGVSLETSIGTLDAEIGAGVSTPQTRTAGVISDQAINLNIEALDDAIGPNVTSTNQLAAAANVNTNLSTIDTKMGPDVTNGVAVLAAASINVNLQALDTEISDRVKESTSSSVTTITTVDSVLVDNIRSVKWLVSCTKVANEADTFCTEMRAIHNGTSSADATATDSSEVGICRTGAAIAGLVVDVALSGVGAAQTLGLTVVSTDAVNVKVTRIKN